MSYCVQLNKDELWSDAKLIPRQGSSADSQVTEAMNLTQPCRLSPGDYDVTQS